MGTRHWAGEGTIHLIAIGKHPAMSVASLQVGDKLVYNYGYTSTIEAIERKGAGSYRITERTDGKGEVFSLTRRGTTKVGWVPREEGEIR